MLKAVNFLSFARACRRQILKLPTPDVVVFETDPFLLPFVADRLRRRRGTKMVGYLQDIYPDIAVALGKVKEQAWVRRLRKKLFEVYTRSEAMVVLSTDMKSLLVDGGVPEDQIEIIPNWADTEAIRPPEGVNRFREEHGLVDKFLVMYSGNLGLTQRLEDFVQAAAKLQSDPNVHFAFIGQGARKDSLMELVQELGLNNVSFYDYQPKSQLAESLGAADLHLIPLTEALSRCLMPSKLYGVLAAGRPYLTNANPSSDLFQITTTHKVGITVAPDNVSEIAERISELKADPARLKLMNANARTLAETVYTRSNSIAQFRQLLRRVTLPGISKAI